MVTFYKENKKKTFDRRAFDLECTSLDLKGRGVGRHNDKVFFVDGLIAGECARVQPLSVKDNTGTAKIIKLLKTSAARRNVSCVYAENCGGCPLGHIETKTAFDAKIQGVRRLFARQLKVELPKPQFTESSKSTGYRRACRLSVRVDHGVMRIGFRSEHSNQLCAIGQCEVFTDRLNAALPVLSEYLDKLSCRSRIGHVELLDSDGALGISLRLVCNLPEKDESILEQLTSELDARISVQEPYVEKLGTDRSEKLRERIVSGSDKELFIEVDGIKISCDTTSFVQVNADVNARMVARVLEALEIKAGMKVIDLFCGLGNFTLPIAKAGAHCVGVDIVRAMTEKGMRNAQNNALPARFAAADLEAPFEAMSFAKDGYNAAVMDPGRSGAVRAGAYIARQKVSKVILISCNPLAAVRDLKTFLNSGYKISSWGAFDMFPRTAHIECLFVLEICKKKAKA